MNRKGAGGKDIKHVFLSKGTILNHCVSRIAPLQLSCSPRVALCVCVSVTNSFQVCIRNEKKRTGDKKTLFYMISN
jgi:hypothetical protein